MLEFCYRCGEAERAGKFRRREELLEARVGIEPTYKGFADLSLTTWVPRLGHTVYRNRAVLSAGKLAGVSLGPSGAENQLRSVVAALGMADWSASRRMSSQIQRRPPKGGRYNFKCNGTRCEIGARCRNWEIGVPR